ncbi:MAG: hypothetical protein AB7S61_11320 [Methanoregulaceae archaeon]
MPDANERAARVRRLQWLKASTPIGIFGSFFRLEALTALRDHLNASGYHARLSLNIGSDMAGAPDPDVYNFEQSKRLVEESAVHIFYLFMERDGESEVNQSATLEVGELLRLCSAQSRLSPIRSCALILLEEGLELRSPLTGAIRSSPCWWEHELFADPAETLRVARKFCHNALRRQPGWDEP